MSIPPGHDGLVEDVVGAAAHIAGAHGMQGRADAEELASRIQPGMLGPGCLFV